MAKRVSRYRVSSAVMATLKGVIGELIVNLTNNSVHVHDGVTAGGFELARADASNMQNATAAQNGRMTVTQVAELADIRVDLTADEATIASHTASISTLNSTTSTHTSQISALDTGKIDIVPTPTLDMFVGQTAGGELTNLGYNLTKGTTKLQFASTLPAGWTLDATLNDHASLSTGTVTGVGGVAGSWTISGISVNGHQLSIGEIPIHAHPGSTAPAKDTLSNGGGFVATAVTNAIAAVPITIAPQGGDGLHSHTMTLGNTWRPLYVKTVWATLNA